VRGVAVGSGVGRLPRGPESETVCQPGRRVLRRQPVRWRGGARAGAPNPRGVCASRQLLVAPDIQKACRHAFRRRMPGAALFFVRPSAEGYRAGARVRAQAMAAYNA